MRRVLQKSRQLRGSHRLAREAHFLVNVVGRHFGIVGCHVIAPLLGLAFEGLQSYSLRNGQYCWNFQNEVQLAWLKCDRGAYPQPVTHRC